jgi:asparagine synthetase B (glutamine-hydrolysing)
MNIRKPRRSRRRPSGYTAVFLGNNSAVLAQISKENSIPTTSHPVAELLRIDAASEVERIANAVRDLVFKQLKRKGAIVGVSGGIDSSVVAAICAHALGKDRVVAIFMPESESAA